MRDIEQPFDDAYVEFIAPRAGMGAVPYVHWTTDPAPAQLIALNTLWWTNDCDPNYLHLIGVEDGNPTNPNSIGGSPFPSAGANQSGASFIYVQKILNSITGTDQIVVNQYCTVHELAHNFSVQGFTVDTYHCLNDAYSPPADGHVCVMHESITGGVPMTPYRDSPPRFCVPHLFTGGNSLYDVPASIRNQQDPLPY